MRLSFRVERDLAEAEAWVDDVQSRARDARPAFERMSESFIRMEKRQFDSEGAYGSGRWAPLSSEYAAWKRVNYGNQPILVATGALRRSLTGGAGYLSFITRDRAVFGSSLPYAGFHQSGTTKMPARPPVPTALPPAVRGAFTRALRAHLAAGQDRQVIE